jgi:spermidine synthase
MMITNARSSLLLFLFFLSGFCNLVYEIVWTRMFGLVFGVTVFAVSAVLASFMMGLAAGAFSFGRIVEEKGDPVLVFSFVHFGIFMSAAAFIAGFPFLKDFFLFINGVIDPGFYGSRVILFVLSLMLMIVPTTLMGATFPVAVKILARGETLGKDVGILYSVNTAGSVAGCLAAVFFLLGSAGMKNTILIAAALDCLIGLAALAMLMFNSRTGAK